MNKHATYLRMYSGNPRDVFAHRDAANEIERLEAELAFCHKAHFEKDKELADAAVQLNSCRESNAEMHKRLLKLELALAQIVDCPTCPRELAKEALKP